MTSLQEFCSNCLHYHSKKKIKSIIYNKDLDGVRLNKRYQLLNQSIEPLFQSIAMLAHL